jgi:hypothetical protein
MCLLSEKLPMLSIAEKIEMLSRFIILSSRGISSNVFLVVFYDRRKI